MKLNAVVCLIHVLTRITQAQAKEWNLVSDVFSPDELMPRVLEFAKQMALAPPLALRRIKQNLNDADRFTSFGDALDIEAER